MAASLALAGLAGCGDADDGRSQEVPFVNKPLRAEPGAVCASPRWRCTDGLANGILVTTRNGRPLKIEGNPEHPWSRGGDRCVRRRPRCWTCMTRPAPRRCATDGRASDWLTFRGAVLGRCRHPARRRGAGLAPAHGPADVAARCSRRSRRCCTTSPAWWHSYAAVDRTAQHDAATRAFGAPARAALAVRQGPRGRLAGGRPPGRRPASRSGWRATGSGLAQGGPARCWRCTPPHRCRA